MFRRLLLSLLAGAVALEAGEGLITIRVDAQNPARMNRMIEALETGRPAISRDTFTWIEQEHAPFDVARTKTQIDAALGKKNEQGQPLLAPFVRIPAEGGEPKRWIVKQILEAGAMGIIVPRLDTAQQALELVQDMRYPQPTGSKYYEPNGRRGCCAFPGNWGLKDPFEYWSGGKGDLWPLNPAGEVFALPMIESPDGVRNLSAILEVPGIGGAIIGTSDLSVTIGEGWVNPLKPSFGPKTLAAFDTVVKTCAAAKKYCGLAAWSAEAEMKYIEMGARIIHRVYQTN